MVGIFMVYKKWGVLIQKLATSFFPTSKHKELGWALIVKIFDKKLFIPVWQRFLQVFKNFGESLKAV